MSIIKLDQKNKVLTIAECSIEHQLILKKRAYIQNTAA